MAASEAAHLSFFPQPIADAKNVFLTWHRGIFSICGGVGRATKEPCDGER
jgi:hypothetical protein